MLISSFIEIIKVHIKYILSTKRSERGWRGGEGGGVPDAHLHFSIIENMIV